jgi:hypothetical protein
VILAPVNDFRTRWEILRTLDGGWIRPPNAESRLGAHPGRGAT